MSMRQLFFRCSHGHWFRRQACPYDGWGHPDVVKAEQLFSADPAMQLSAFSGQGIEHDLVQRILILESEFIPEGMEGISLKSCIVDGNVDERFGKEWS